MLLHIGLSLEVKVNYIGLKMVVHICEAIAKSNRELLEVVTDARISEGFQEF